LEEFWRASSREDRVGGGYTVVDTPVADTEEIPVSFENGTWSQVEDKDDANGTLVLGPAGAGGLVRISLEPGVVEPGASAAPVVAAAFALADRLWNTGIGEVVPAVDVRT
jgi:hypothetical protein